MSDKMIIHKDAEALIVAWRFGLMPRRRGKGGAKCRNKKD